MPADVYWLKRLKRDRALARRSAAAVEAEVRKAYRAQYLQAARRLDELYAEAMTRGTLSRTKLWNYRTYRAMERDLAEFCEAGSVIQREAIEKCLNRVFEEVIGASPEAFRQEKYIVRYDPRAVIDTAWSGESFSTRIWRNTGELAQRIRGECQQIVMGLQSPGTVKKRLMADFDVSFRQASRLVDTEVSYVLNRANIEQYRAEGFNKVTIVNLDVNTCDRCKAVEGEVFNIYDAPVLPLHPHCHCSYCVPREFNDAEVTASRATLDELYERKGVGKGGETSQKGGKTSQAGAKQYAPKGTKANANPSRLAGKIEAAAKSAPATEGAVQGTRKSAANPQTPAAVSASTPTSMSETQGARTPENTDALAVSELTAKAESGIIEAYKDRLSQRAIIKNSEVKNGLPIDGIPDGIADLVDESGKVLKRRVYGEDGLAAVDYDTGDHNRPDIHVTGAHKHVFDYTRKNARGKWLTLTDDEKQMNSDIIKEGVNYYAGGRTH